MAPLNKGQIVGITLGSTVGGIIFVVVLFYSLYALRSAIWVAMTVFEQRYEERRENVPRCFSSNESLSSSTLSRLTQSQNRHIVVYEGLAHYIPPPPSPPPSVDGAPAADRSASPDSISPGATLRDDQLSESCYYIVSGQRTQAVDCSTFLYQLKQPPSTQSLDPSPRFPSAMSIRYNPKLFTIENLLRTDKRSQLIEISEQATSSRDITVALGRNAFDSTRPGAIDATRVINPLELEIRLNPVHFAPSQAEPPMHYDVENSPRSSITFMSNQKEEHAKNPRSPYQADQDSLAIPDLSPSIGKGSEDIDMIEPVTPLTSSFTLDSNTTSKICRTSLTSSPLSVDEADDAGEGLSCELYASKSDLHGTAPFSHDLQILQAHCESAMIEDVVQKMSIPVSAPSSTQLASPCAESILPSSAFLDSTQSESHSSPSVDEAVTNQDTLRKRLLDHSSSNDTTTFTCAHCHLPFPTKGKVNDHVNRRHNLRFSCSVCSYKCGLRADLKRHLQTVHSDKYRPVQSFRCPNDSCGSTWRRKDHFKRHLGRCEKRCMISACV